MMGIKEISRVQADGIVGLMAVLVALELMELEEFISIGLDLDEYVTQRDPSYWTSIFSVALSSSKMVRN
jgi:hypothetical protein